MPNGDSDQISEISVCSICQPAGVGVNLLEAPLPVSHRIQPRRISPENKSQRGQICAEKKHIQPHGLVLKHVSAMSCLNHVRKQIQASQTLTSTPLGSRITGKELPNRQCHHFFNVHKNVEQERQLQLKQCSVAIKLISDSMATKWQGKLGELILWGKFFIKT